MNKNINFSHLGGLFVYQTTLDFLQTAYTDAIDNIAAGYGEKVIVAGLLPAGGNTVTNGWVVLNGQLLPVMGGTVEPYLFLDTTITDEYFADGVQRPVYTTKILKFTSVAAGNYLFTDFVRLPFCTASLKDGFTNIQTLFKKAFFSEAIILEGGIATDAGGGNVAITAGNAFIGGKLASFSAFAGASPVYLNTSGQWVNAIPAGEYITYDYDTSQFYEDVLLRKSNRSGALVMRANHSELIYFDPATGLGRWRWLGWKISDAMGSRVPLGYDRRAFSTDAEWDALYNGVGNAVGEKKHLLLTDEMPQHDHTTHGKGAIPGGSDGNKFLSRNNNALSKGQGSWSFGGQATPDVEMRTSDSGGTSPHENRQPSRVTLFIERI